MLFSIGRLTFLVYTRCHTELKSIDEHVKTVDVITDWAEIALDKCVSRKSRPIVVFDSYYLSAEGLAPLRLV